MLIYARSSSVQVRSGAPARILQPTAHAVSSPTDKTWSSLVNPRLVDLLGQALGGVRATQNPISGNPPQWGMT